MEASASWFILQVILGREPVEFQVISHLMYRVTYHEGLVIDGQRQLQDGAVTHLFNMLVYLVHRGISEFAVTHSLA